MGVAMILTTYDEVKRARLRVTPAQAIAECKRHGFVAYLSCGGNHLVVEIEIVKGGVVSIEKDRVKMGRDGMFSGADVLEVLGY
jgi:hypothetical protein